MSFIKRLLFALYLWYCTKLPWKRGNGFLCRRIQHLGFARYDINGTKLELNPSAWIDRILISGEHHDPFVSQAITERLGAGGIFVDIGANIGVFTLAAAKMPGVFVYAFEPSPRELSRLYRNLALNAVNNVVVYPVALGRSSASLKLFLGSYENPGNNTFVPETAEQCARQGVVCHCDAFDALFPTEIVKQIKIVKIDVEGFEMEVLSGMSRAIMWMKDAAFVVEVTRSFLLRSGSSAEELYRFFQERGFSAHIGIQSQERWDELFVKDHDGAT